jgi:PAS domain S-box-containing protein
MDDRSGITNPDLEKKVEDPTSQPFGTGEQTQNPMSGNDILNELSVDEGRAFRSVVENLPEVFFSLTLQGRISYLNPAFQTITGWSCVDWTGRPFIDLIHPDDITFVQKSLVRFISREELSPIEVTFLTKDGSSLIGEVSAVFHKKEDGKTINILGMVHDITDRKKTEEKLSVQEKRIRSLYEISAEPGFGIDQQITETIKTGCDMLGLDMGIIGHIAGKDYTVLYCFDKFGAITEGLKLNLDNTYCSITLSENDVIALDHVGLTEYRDHPCYKEFKLESYIAVPLSAKGEIFGTMNFSSLRAREIPFNSEDKEFIRLMGRWVSTMIERKQTEVMLSDKEELYRTLVENAHDLIIETKVDGTLVFLNSNHKELLGYDTEYLMGKSVFDYIHEDDHNPVISEFMRALMSNSAANAVFRFKHKNGEWRWLESAGKSFKTSNGQIRWVIDSRDVTDRKRTEEHIRKSLREKESLLREIHHRVKNNLQIISSLLSLQSDYAKGLDSSKLFDESQNRISTIALIHEQLYQSEDLAEINIGEYIANLTNNLLTVYGDEGSNVSVKFNTDDLNVDIDIAIPCGLIINELFSNCLKHAFKCRGKNDKQKTDVIIVGFTSDSNGQYILSVEDNGCGLPPSLDFKETETLGLQLVCTLADQLSADIELRADKGTRFDIRFPNIANK